MFSPRVITGFIIGLITVTALAGEPSELVQAKRDYAQASSHPSEAVRSSYLTRLVRMRERYAKLKTDEWKAIDAEIIRHAVPRDSDARVLSKMLVGQWASPRHDYIYRSDGTWSMLPEEPDTTHGRWRIEGNQLLDLATDLPFDAPAAGKTHYYTILLLTDKITPPPMGSMYFT